MLFNVRRIGTPDEAPDIVAHRLAQQGKPEQGRFDFFLQRTAQGLFCWACCAGQFDTACRYVTPELAYWSTFSSAQGGLVRRLARWVITTPRAPIDWIALAVEARVKLTLVFTFVYWSVLSISAVHITLSLFFVIVLRLDAPRDWPPLFHAPTKITSLRSYWRLFWHSMLYRASVVWAKALVFGVARVKRGSALATHALRAAVFAITTGIHIAVTVFGRAKCAAWDDEVYWWTANFVGIMLEGYVSTYTLRLIHRMPDGRGKRWALRTVNAVGPWIGRLWVLVFLFWSVGKMEYNKYECHYNKATRGRKTVREKMNAGTKNKTST
jgi:hypothetical protein